MVQGLLGIMINEEQIQGMINRSITEHERRVGFISGVFGGFWLVLNIMVVVYLVCNK
jgi:hypothetical protein